MREALRIAILASEMRFGNCGPRADLIAKYLWEHPFCIHRIEKISLANVDHVFIVVNRSGDLKNPDTWGDAWCLDAWYGEEGLIFPAREFKEKIKIITHFAKDQIKQLKSLGVEAKEPDINQENDIGAVIYEIAPSRDRYPSFSPYKRVEDYYVTLNSYGKDCELIITDREKYQSQFNYCLNEIESLNTEKRNAFFEKRKIQVRKPLERKTTTYASHDYSEIAGLLYRLNADPSKGIKSLMDPIDSNYQGAFKESKLLNSAYQNGTLLLLLAAHDDDPYVANSLIQHGADINLALYIAVTLKKLNIAQFLLSGGANPNALFEGAHAMDVAMNHRDFEMAKLLVNAGAYPAVSAKFKMSSFL